jgi:N-acetylneuraminate synthase
MAAPLVVAEIGLNHDGELWAAKTLISLAASLGVDFVKFQKRNIDVCYKRQYLDTRKVTRWGTTVRDEKLGLEFNEKQYDAIAEHCAKEGIGWFASPYTSSDVEFLEKYNLPYIKIASQCVCNPDLMQAVRETGRKVIVSTGMCTKESLGDVVSFFGDSLVYILHCTLTYPTDDKDVNLSAMVTMQREYPTKKIGFSSHSQKIIYPVAAVALGAEMVEFHVTLDRNWDGPDHAASVGPVGFARVMSHIESLRVGRGSGIIAPHEGAIKKSSNYAWR